jgi:hypothetical protein
MLTVMEVLTLTSRGDASVNIRGGLESNSGKLEALIH